MAAKTQIGPKVEDFYFLFFVNGFLLKGFVSLFLISVGIVTIIRNKSV